MVGSVLLTHYKFIYRSFVTFGRAKPETTISSAIYRGSQ